MMVMCLQFSLRKWEIAVSRAWETEYQVEEA